MADVNVIAGARIGKATGYFVFGLLLLAFGLFAALAAAGGARDAEAFADFALLIAGVLIAIGFWIRLFGLIELRLIDIETAIKGSRA